jgi:DNA helicase-2/ATP-dependent DNA helicase PcrA
MKFKPTEEQKSIFHYIKTRNENILIQAYAGTGKSTTIIEAVKLIDPTKSITFLAFNKHIQEELKEKLPEHVRCYTTYGLGNSAILRKYKNIKFDEFKIDKIINKKSKNWDLDSEFNTYEELTEYLRDVKKLVNLCRLTLTLKSEYIPYLADRHDINLNKTKDIKRVMKVLDEATTDRTLYDYTDMVFLPAVDNSIWMFPQDYVFIDEVQDTNRCQIKIIEKILKKDRVTGKITGRLIAVGDKFQSIYGFNASDEKSFEWYEKYPNTKTLPLSYSFRCPKNVIKYANEIVPDIKPLDTAIDGIVREGNVLEEAQSGDLVLCRTTAPLIKLFFELLLQHKKAFVRGGDIGLNLIDMIGNIKTIPILIAHWEDILRSFRQDLHNKGIMNPQEHTGYVALEDKVSVLIFLCGMSKDIQNLIFKIKLIFDDENNNGIILSTVHKAKGSEADRVFIIRPTLMPLPNSRGWQYGQEMNLKYVAITRAKKELVIDNDWTDEE